MVSMGGGREVNSRRRRRAITEGFGVLSKKIHNIFRFIQRGNTASGTHSDSLLCFPIKCFVVQHCKVQLVNIACRVPTGL